MQNETWISAAYRLLKSVSTHTAARFCGRSLAAWIGYLQVYGTVFTMFFDKRKIKSGDF